LRGGAEVVQARKGERIRTSESEILRDVAELYHVQAGLRLAREVLPGLPLVGLRWRHHLGFPGLLVAEHGETVGVPPRFPGDLLPQRCLARLPSLDVNQGPGAGTPAQRREQAPVRRPADRDDSRQILGRSCAQKEQVTAHGGGYAAELDL